MAGAGYQMNPQVGRAMGAAPSAPAAPEQPTQTITLTKNPDGTVTCDDGTGTPSVHQSVDEALSYAGQKLGASGGEQPAGDAAGAGSDVDDQY